MGVYEITENNDRRKGDFEYTGFSRFLHKIHKINGLTVGLRVASSKLFNIFLRNLVLIVYTESYFAKFNISLYLSNVKFKSNF